MSGAGGSLWAILVLNSRDAGGARCVFVPLNSQYPTMGRAVNILAPDVLCRGPQGSEAVSRDRGDLERGSVNWGAVRDCPSELRAPHHRIKYLLYPHCPPRLFTTPKRARRLMDGTENSRMNEKEATPLKIDPKWFVRYHPLPASPTAEGM